MNTQDGGYYDEAVAGLATNNFESAGDAYARAAWQTLANPRPDQEPFDADEKGWIGHGLGHLVTSAICYRVAGRPNRAASRGTEASVLADDFETVLTHPAQRACLQELRADATLAGGSDSPQEAYRATADAYRDAAAAVDDPQYWGTTPLFEAAATPLQQVARSTADGEIAIAWEDLHGADPAQSGRYLASRARVKRQQFPALLDSVIEEGSLAAPRGTTEYNNATYQCQNCGSTDVNWIGDSVLCLRCSTPMQQQ